MIKINESISDVMTALDEAGIPCRARGTSMIVVPKDQLDKATEIKNSIDSSITIGSQA